MNVGLSWYSGACDIEEKALALSKTETKCYQFSGLNYSYSIWN